MALTETALKNARPREKAYRIKDEHGLFAEVKPSGAISFRVRYWFRGRDSLVTLGRYPVMTLREARERCLELRRQLMNGLDPAAIARFEATAESRRPPSFGDIAEEWLRKKLAETKSERNGKIIEYRLRRFILPALGGRLPDEITAPLLLSAVLRPIEADGHRETAKRVNSICGQVFRYAIVTGRASRDPTRDLTGALTAPEANHFASITDPSSFGVLLSMIHSYEGSATVREAMKLLYLTFVRPGELRLAEWVEFDLGAAIWRIPAPKMKMKREHVVPLSRQAVEVLEFMKPRTGGWRYVFPGARAFHGERAISDMAIIQALRSMGYERGVMTAHGFRHSASTLLNESRLWSGDAIERQLAHSDKDKIRATYNQAQYLDERREMLQWWADYCDALRNNAEQHSSSSEQY